MEHILSWLVFPARWVLNGIYKLLNLLPRGPYAVFLSRQASAPSYDFLAIGEALEEHGFQCIYLVKKLTVRDVVPYLFFSLRSLYWLARCQVCIVDRYNPLVSLIDFKCERYSDNRKYGQIKHYEFPCEPVVLQVWHAFGAFKKFGYQSINTQEGHSGETAERFDIHRNYSWILCTGEAARIPYAEAFSYPVDRVVALGRPEYDRLLAVRAQDNIRDDDCLPPRKLKILIAPTLRKNERSSHPLKNLYDGGALSQLAAVADISWSFHPLDSDRDAPGGVSQGLLNADCVITDYSSIVYEAWILGKKAFFYIEDIDDFVRSPGLFTNPAEICPSLVARSESELVEKVSQFISSGQYPQIEFDRFVSGMVDAGLAGAADAIADFVGKALPDERV